MTSIEQGGRGLMPEEPPYTVSLSPKGTVTGKRHKRNKDVKSKRKSKKGKQLSKKKSVLRKTPNSKKKKKKLLKK